MGFERSFTQSHDDPRIDLTIKDCPCPRRDICRSFPCLECKILKRSRPSPFFRHSENWKAFMKLWAASAVTRDCLRGGYRKSGIPGLTQRVEQRSTEIRNLLLFFEMEWLKFDDTIANRLSADPTLEAYRHYLHKLAPLTGRIRSPSWKKRSSTTETTPGAMPSAGFFRRSRRR